MKFNLSEDLFDVSTDLTDVDDNVNVGTFDDISINSDVDDDFGFDGIDADVIETNCEKQAEEAVNCEFQIYTDALQQHYNMINMYNSIIRTLKDQDADVYKDVDIEGKVAVLNSIIDSENECIGKIKALIDNNSTTNTQSIDRGYEDAVYKIETNASATTLHPVFNNQVGAIGSVQAQPQKAMNPDNPNEISNECELCDVDDTF